MVLEYAENGNLRKYLENNFNLTWNEKLQFLKNIAWNLHIIHSKKYVHKDLHSGNILQFNTTYASSKITDLGLAQLINNSKSSNASSVCGVLPYIAPEVLDGKPYTFASDVYSFGIIMVEISTGKPPYGSVPHDEKLALAVCNGLRPRVAKGTPQCYIDLVNQCLDANPEKRPAAEKLWEIIRNWQYEFKEFIDTKGIISQEFPSETATNPEAIYTSRFMSFSNLSKPINSTRVQIEDPEGIVIINCECIYLLITNL
jgi:serine/threonine protein kinase